MANGQWLQIMITMDANKMRHNVAFPGIKFRIFWGRATAPSATPHRNVFYEFSRFNRRLSFV